MNTSGGASTLPILDPNLQVSFYYKLQQIRQQWLHEALSAAVQQTDIEKLDKELSDFADLRALRKVASFGIRGEVFFPAPCLIITSPQLLGYYRLLLGFSQKEFYTKRSFGRFKRLEQEGQLGAVTTGEIGDLCSSLAASCAKLVSAIDNLSPGIVSELQLLTLGPQLRGSENTRIGQEASERIFDLIKSLASSYVREVTRRTMIIENDSKRMVIVEFSNDPDIRIVEQLTSGIRPLVAVEIKGGADVSNIHNRLGEAEKSHQKAKGKGFYELWTILRVDVAEEIARRESPTTSSFFRLDGILEAGSTENRRFAESLGSILGIQV